MGPEPRSFGDAVDAHANHSPNTVRDILTLTAVKFGLIWEYGYIEVVNEFSE